MLYTTSGGANICSSSNGKVIVSGTEENGTIYQALQIQNGEDSDIADDEWVTYTITPAKLKNSDNPYTETAKAADTLTYTYTDGFWQHNGVAQWDYTTTDSSTNKSVSHSKIYATLANAVTAYGGTGYIQMLTNTTETIKATSDIIVDLIGHTVTLNDDSSVANVYFMDKSTDGYADSSGRVIASSEVAKYIPDMTSCAINSTTDRHYLKVMDASGHYAFPRVATTLSGIGYRSNASGSYLTYRNTFRGNTLAKDSLTAMGFMFGKSELWPDSNFVLNKNDMENSTGYTIFAHYDMVKPTTLPTSVLSQVEFDNSKDKVVISSYPTEAQLAAAFSALGLK